MATTTQIQNDIIEIYIASFDRAPDAAGLAYWVDNVTNQGWSISDVAKSIFQSPEVANKYPASLSNEAFLNTVYNNTLGRDADAAGMAYWLDQMAAGLTRDEMILTIINGAKADTGSADDRLYLENKEKVGYHFAVTLGLDDVTLAKECLSHITTLSSSVDEAEDRLDAYKDSLDDTVSLFEGDDSDNTINGTNSTNHIYSFGGDDDIMAGDGDNVVVSGAGIDTIYAGSGNDTIKTRTGNDTVYAGPGNDTIYGDEGNDSLHGEDGDDTVYGGDGNDYIYADAGNDTLNGGDGNDTINGGDGDDTIYGNAGDDVIDAGDGNNFVDAGDGNDTVYGGTAIDKIYGGAGDDTVYGLEGADILDGLTGNDTIYGGAGDDIINGNEGDDILNGGSGNDNISGESGSDKIGGGAGADILTGGEGRDTFTFRAGDSDLTTLDEIMDFTFGADKLALVNHGSEVISVSKTDISTATTLTEAADMAAAQDGSANALVHWFTYNDNTYVVEDMSAEATFQDSSDIIIELQGIVDLQGVDTSTISFI